MNNLTFYLICFIPPALLALYAQGLVKSRYAAALRKPASLNGAETARRLLDGAGLYNVQVRMIAGTLTDHYDPRTKTVNLSRDIYEGRTLASVGIAAHEAGHAIQDGTGYSLMVIRQMAVPLANFGSGIAFYLLLAGMMFHIFGLAILGALAFAGVAVFQIINLPVEYNASSRAKTLIAQMGLVTAEEQQTVRKVLSAAALTYVAATLASILQFVYFFVRAMASRD